MTKKWAYAALLSLHGCADPASQAPVALSPGLYEVRLTGGTMLEFKPREQPNKLCIPPDAAADFATAPLPALIGNWDDCSDDQSAPLGNALRGARRCQMTHSRRQPLQLDFGGAHDDRSFFVSGEIEQGADENGGWIHFGSGSFTMSGRRVGDCAI